MNAVRPISLNVLDLLPRRKPPADRLAELRVYAEALALRAEYRGDGNQRDLNDIVSALDELKDLREWAKMETALTNEKPLPKHHGASKPPRPKRPAPQRKA